MARCRDKIPKCETPNRLISYGEDIVYSLQKYKVEKKIDYGSILLSTTNEDQENLERIIVNTGFKKPNLKLSIYKNRRGRYKGIYLWCDADLGTCRVKPMFATTWSYELIQINNLKIETVNNFN